MFFKHYHICDITTKIFEIHPTFIFSCFLTRKRKVTKIFAKNASSYLVDVVISKSQVLAC